MSEVNTVTGIANPAAVRGPRARSVEVKAPAAEDDELEWRGLGRFYGRPYTNYPDRVKWQRVGVRVISDPTPVCRRRPRAPLTKLYIVAAAKSCIYIII